MCFFFFGDSIFFPPGGEIRNSVWPPKAIRHCQNPTPHGRTWLKVQRWRPCSLKSMHKRPVSEVQDRSFLWGIVVLQIWSWLRRSCDFQCFLRASKGKKSFLLLIFFGEGSCDLIHLLVLLIVHGIFQGFFRLKHPFRYAKLPWKSTVLDTVSRCWLRLRLRSPCFFGTSFLIGSFIMRNQGAYCKLPKRKMSGVVFFFLPAIYRYVQPATLYRMSTHMISGTAWSIKGLHSSWGGQMTNWNQDLGFWFLIKIFWLSFEFSRSFVFFLSFFSLSFGFVTCWNFITLTFVISSLVTLMVSFNISDWTKHRAV